jgi:acetyl-CoA acetyltransferase
MPGLKDKYAIVGIGMTEFSRNSGRTTRALGVEAVRAAMVDAGLGAGEVDGMLSYHGNDSTSSPTIAGDLGIRLNFYMDCSGGGSSTEALIGIAMGVIEAGMCSTVAIFRAMNGFTEARIGGTGRQRPVFTGGSLEAGIHGMNSAGQSFAPSFMRHGYEYGTSSVQVAHVKVAHSKHAAWRRTTAWQSS